MGSTMPGMMGVALVLSISALSLKMLFLGVQTARARGTAKRFMNPEDTAWLGGETVASDTATTARWRRAHLNDIENFVPFVALGSAYVLLGGSLYVGLGYIGLFTVSRFVHTVAYLGNRPRMRRDAYTIGFLVLAAMALHVASLGIGRLIV